jgi:hypothetical protein
VAARKPAAKQSPLFTQSGQLVDLDKAVYGQIFEVLYFSAGPLNCQLRNDPIVPQAKRQSQRAL